MKYYQTKILNYPTLLAIDWIKRRVSFGRRKRGDIHTISTFRYHSKRSEGFPSSLNGLHYRKSFIVSLFHCGLRMWSGRDRRIANGQRAAKSDRLNRFVCKKNTQFGKLIEFTNHRSIPVFAKNWVENSKLEINASHFFENHTIWQLKGFSILLGYRK